MLYVIPITMMFEPSPSYMYQFDNFKSYIMIDCQNVYYIIKIDFFLKMTI